MLGAVTSILVHVAAVCTLVLSLPRYHDGQVSQQVPSALEQVSALVASVLSVVGEDHCWCGGAGPSVSQVVYRVAGWFDSCVELW